MMNTIIIRYPNKLIVIFIFSVLFLNEFTHAQTKQDVILFYDLYQVHEHKNNYGQYLKNTSNELSFITNGLFVFYKEFFSSQDGNHCVFYPSCSIYTMDAIKKQGLILGLINGIDRLSRCNRLSPENYTFYKNTHLFYDPIK